MLKTIIYTSMFALLLLVSCKTNTNVEDNQKPTVVTTTGMVKDAVLNLVGDAMEVEALMGAGVDPHLYQASPGDLSKLNKADVIVFNGLFLEGKLHSILEKLAQKKKVVNFSSAINTADLIEVTEKQYEDEIYDPHIWFDIDVWKQGINGLANQLSEFYPSVAPKIEENKTVYFKSLDSLKNELVKKMNQIPVENRILVTSHDAFHYYGRMLDVRVEALQGLSTATDFGLKDRKELVDLIIAENVKAIFIESSVGDKPIKAILADCSSKGSDVALGGTLFSDAMGAEGTFEGTYIGMLTHNTNTIVAGLNNNE